ncbi:hypothetical protein ELE36_02600 [Pseudolysobacter antarcticus]|uniref:Uncharacterized protein n=1 Tax=Pseudolysobacter antarcticus TaxID=2511995 RepID=A0A411HFT8_9GAMM|nr:hypothetical protein [Pseudolysobacter antarcticus]QBB69352.1 hypothetical protein ELE36_02600 [Pseudolysobacter antarcticus]
MSAILNPALRELSDIVSDLRQTPFQGVSSVVERFLLVLDTAPLAGFLQSVLAPFDFDAWWAASVTPPLGMIGSGSLRWPTERGARVAAQIEACRRIADKRLDLVRLIHDNFPNTSQLSQIVATFVSNIVVPLVRDVSRLTESRPIPTLLSDQFGRVPPSGDATLDALIAKACSSFRDPAPATRQQATQTLWDAWERLKTLDGDKKVSAQMLLENAAQEVEFRKVLEEEARALTQIGNRFEIRHSETTQIPLARIEHWDYLFHRMFAMIQLLLACRRPTA